MASVTLADVRKTYAGGVDAVKGISLDIPDGHMCVLVGPSGCGKSTLLRMVAGLETISSGAVYIAGALVNELEPADRDIAMVFQNYALYPHMSVYENMAYGLKNRGMPKIEIAERVADAAKMLEIGHLLDRRPRQLSGGQRQRVAMGRAIVRRPKVFLFDEPLSNLDAKLRVSMRIEIRQLQRRLGITSIYVTHDQLEAMTLADMLVVMNGGGVEQVGPPLEVYQHPQTTFVASFIGAPPMNLLSFGPKEIRAWLGAACPDLPAEPIVLGVRPEDLSLRDGVALPGTTAFQMTVQAIEHIGPETLVYGSLATGGELIIRLPGRQAPEIGGKVTALAPADKLHLFRAADGVRLARNLRS